MAMTAWERALRDDYIAQQVYILMFLVLDGRAYREILLIDAHPRVQAWHQQLADIIATVMHQHGHTTPRYGTLARRAAQGNGVRRMRATLASRRADAVSGLGRAASEAAGSPESHEPAH